MRLRIAYSSDARRAASAALAAACALLAAIACGSPARLSTGPTPVKCQVTLNAASRVVAAAGGNGTIEIATNPECTWTAVANAAWIASLAPQSGQGSATLEYQASANPAAAAREGQITVNDAQVRIQQEAAPCVFDVTPLRHVIDGAGGSGEVSIATLSACSWSASSDDPWISITTARGGSGSGVLRFDVAPNGEAPRTGSLTVAGKVSIVEQADSGVVTPGCSYTLSAPSAAMPGGGGPGSVAIEAAPACAWTVSSLVPWITVVSAASGRGSGVINFVAAPNAGTARVGALRIAGQSFVVSQDAAASCSATIAPTQQAFPVGGGASLPVSVSVAPGCSWTTTSDVPWIAITAGSSGSGSGSVAFTVAPNPGGARAAVLRIAGQAFNVNQAGSAPCSYSITPRVQSVGAAGGANFGVDVAAAAGCAWTAASQASWITVTSNAGGSGNGTVRFAVAANDAAARTGSLLVAGETFTVTQASRCSYTIAPTSRAMGPGDGTGQVLLSTASDCDWTATSGVPWMSITAGSSGRGTGTVEFSVTANHGAPRSGSLTIADQTFSVTQATCTYAISPTTASTGHGGGVSSVNVTAAAGCAWTAVSNVSWIRIRSGDSGAGNGTVFYDVERGLIFSRTGTLTIAGHTFTVSQNGMLVEGVAGGAAR